MACVYVCCMQVCTFFQQSLVEEASALFHCTSFNFFFSVSLWASGVLQSVYWNKAKLTYPHPLKNNHQAQHPKPQESQRPLHHSAYLSPALIIIQVQSSNSG